MAIDIKALRKRYKEAQPKKLGAKTIPFHQLRFNQSMELQFLPAINENSASYWAIRRTFPTYWTDPEDDSKQIIMHLPSPKMFDPAASCPFGARCSELYSQRDELQENGEDTEAKRIGAVASAHWTKPKMLLQCLVNEWSGVDDPNEDNPVKVISLSKQGADAVMGGLENGSMDGLPSGSWEMGDLSNSVNLSDYMFECTPFILRKTKQGVHNNYTTSHYGTTTQYTQEQIDDVLEHGLYDWSSLLPREPSEEQLEIMDELHAISVAYQLGEDVDNTFDPEWEKELGLKGFEHEVKEDKKPAKPARKTKAKPAAEEPSDEAKADAKDKLKTLKGRGAKSKADEPDATPQKSKAAANLRKRIAARAASNAA